MRFKYLKFCFLALSISSVCFSGVASEFVVQIDEDIGFYSATYSAQSAYDVSELTSFPPAQRSGPEELILFVLGSFFSPNSFSVEASELFEKEESDDLKERISKYSGLSLEATYSDAQVRFLEKVIFSRSVDGKRYAAILFEIVGGLEIGTAGEFVLGFVEDQGRWKVAMPRERGYFEQFFFETDVRCVEMIGENHDSQSYLPCQESN